MNKPDKYPICKQQPAEIDCRVTDCIYHAGACKNLAPTITLHKDKEFHCWSCSQNIVPIAKHPNKIMKKYELIKDLPDLKAGAIFTSKEVERANDTIDIVYHHNNGGELYDTFMCWNYLAKNVENNTEFFKQILIPVKVISIIPEGLITLEKNQEAIIITSTHKMNPGYIKERVESAFAEKAETPRFKIPDNLDLSKSQMERIAFQIKKWVKEELRINEEFEKDNPSTFQSPKTPK